MARSVDYYFSLQSPWAYIGDAPFHKVATAHGLTINYKPMPLLDVFSETGGLPLGKRHPARQRYRIVELQRWRDKRGLDFHFLPKHWPFNPRLADGVMIAAVQGGQNVPKLLTRLYDAVWKDQYDLTDSPTLVKLADEVGLPGDTLVKQSASDEIGAIYEQNRQDAIGVDVFGSPAYVLDGEVFWGQDRIDLLDDALKSGRAAYGSAI
ncbi:MAG: 2-hydroxychromene-2-carboxylate isomerase [Bradyrhizobiaceae bacterium]|nr:MAG: 2-hydroxychromene-2-carboxylate isomerase [Bradyrhizobiaceae bacterium]